MKHISVFNGIGGFSLAAHWCGWRNVAHVEIDRKSNKKYKAIFPKSQEYEDIKEFEPEKYRGAIDIISGGDPCQPSSVAGLGKGTEDDRYLWPEMLRVIRSIQPAWVVNENVPGTISNGILDIKCADLESEGYACQAFSIPAESVGAFHCRQRIWLIAFNPNYHNINRAFGEVQGEGNKKELQKWNEIQHSCEPVNLWAECTHSDVERFKKQYNPSQSGTLPERVSGYFGISSYADGVIPREVLESAVMGMLNGLPEELDFTDRTQRIKEAGQAVCPPLVYEIFDMIDFCHKNGISL